MNFLRMIIMAGCVTIGMTPCGHAQVSWIAKATRELVEAVAAKGGQQATKEFVALGGETLARETLEKAVQEGGEQLVQRMTTQVIAYGPALLKVGQSSPSRFVSAFEELTPAMRSATAQAMTREPELMGTLFSDLGKDALTAAAQHPGVGTQVMSVLGKDGAEALGKIATDDAIQLCRVAPKLADVTEPERRALLQIISESPGKTMKLLEDHPTVFKTAAALTAFIALKREIIGDEEIAVDTNGMAHVIRKRGVIPSLVKTFYLPLSTIVYACAAIVIGWGGIKLWAITRVERVRVALKEAQLGRDDLRSQRPPKRNPASE